MMTTLVGFAGGVRVVLSAAAAAGLGAGGGDGDRCGEPRRSMNRDDDEP